MDAKERTKKSGAYRGVVWTIFYLHSFFSRVLWSKKWSAVLREKLRGDG